MEKTTLLILCINIFLNVGAQKIYSNYSNEDIIDYTIINNEKGITNEMIFKEPYHFRKSKKPLYLVNGFEVECISYYNKEEIKSIVVIQPKEALLKYKNKGRNGVIIVKLKDNVKEPIIKIVSNKIYYKCVNENNIEDTTKNYFDKVNGKNCKTLNLTDTAKMQTVYMNFDNVIYLKNLGAGWDRTTISINGGSFTGIGKERIIRVTKKGIATITIGREINNKNKSTIIKLKIADLPKWN